MENVSDLWHTDLDNIGLPSNMMFGFGAEFGDTIHCLQKTDNIRWCIFTVDRHYYVIEQQSTNGEWIESWTKQMNKCKEEAKAYAESSFANYYS